MPVYSKTLNEEELQKITKYLTKIRTESLPDLASNISEKCFYSQTLNKVNFDGKNYNVNLLSLQPLPTPHHHHHTLFFLWSTK